MPLPLNQVSGMPQMSSAFFGWKNNISLIKIVQTIDDDGFVVETNSVINFKGVWQPMSMEQIAIKPDGERAWQWITLHVEGSNVLFKRGDKIMRLDQRYKVMGVKDFTLNNYSEYELVKDYQDE